ncbi:hypothetical protein [Nonomuraea jabiensis]|uniref:hypothetical protein n=1 Tax=Nonomuraea jabiensis TaxID=882448 RepID=UPI0036969E16
MRGRAEIVGDEEDRAYLVRPIGLAMAAITGLYSHISREENRFMTYVLNPADPGEWAVAVHQRGDPDHIVYQMGDRPLWEEVTDAYFRWVSWGEPGRDRFGMTVTTEGQHVWLDTPERVVSGPSHG